MNREDPSLICFFCSWKFSFNRNSPENPNTPEKLLCLNSWERGVAVETILTGKDESHKNLCPARSMLAVLTLPLETRHHGQLQHLSLSKCSYGPKKTENGARCCPHKDEQGRHHHGGGHMVGVTSQLHPLLPEPSCPLQPSLWRKSTHKTQQLLRKSTICCISSSP